MVRARGTQLQSTITDRRRIGPARRRVPIWRDYMRTQIFSLVQERAIVLNWSERKVWPRWSLRVPVFHHFGGAGAFNPLVILFRPFRPARAFRFWLPFRDWKRGYREPVERLRQELVLML